MVEGLPRQGRSGRGAGGSRFSRNSRDWQQLIEMCRVVDTVLIDQETVYAHGRVMIDCCSA